MYRLFLNAVIPETEGANLVIRFDSHGGVSYETSGYRYGRGNINMAGTGSDAGSGSESYTAGIVIANSLSNTTANYDGTVVIRNPLAATKPTRITTQGAYVAASGNLSTATCSGELNVAEADDSIQVIMSTGNITSGTFTLYGLRL
jgi:hypothetical protein